MKATDTSGATLSEIADDVIERTRRIEMLELILVDATGKIREMADRAEKQFNEIGGILL